MNRDLYIVCPAKAGDEKPWKLTRNGEPMGFHNTQQGAIDCAVLLCRNRLKLLGKLSELQIHGRDGQIKDKRTYGDDPIATKG